MFTNNRKQLRMMYFSAWQKHQDKLELTPLEKQITAIIAMHPEYHKIFNKPEKYIDKDYLPEFGETNPFMHMGLHLGLHEQLSTDRPQGIAEVYDKLCKKLKDPHKAEHAMQEKLAEMMWKAQREGKMPDESVYLQSLRDLL